MKGSKSGMHCFLAAVLLPAGALLASGAGAQQGVLEEVIVTAEKREQSIQELPISIEAFDAERLETLQISGFEDIAQHVPGLYDGPNSADVGGRKIYIRGVGADDPQVGLDSRLALYVDGIYVGKSVGLAFDAVDLERVEVLKGPQGTLYGRNAVAGAINLISRKADPEEFDARASFTAGNYSALKFKGHVNIPVSDRLAVKFSAYLSEADGWVENKGAGEDFAGYEREGARLDVAFIHSDRMRFDYFYEYTDSDNQPLFYQSIGNAGTDPWNYSAYLADPVIGKRQDKVNANFGAKIETAAVETEAHTLLGRWDWSDNHYAKLLVGWREVKARRFNIFYPEVKQDCVDAGCPEANSYGRPLSFFLEHLLFTEPTPAAPANTDLFGFLDGTEHRTALLGGQASLAANSSIGGDPLMNPAESWSVELNQIGSLLDGRLEYTGGIYYFKEEIENASSPAPYEMLGILTASAAAIGTYQGVYNGTLNALTNNVDGARDMVRQGVAAGIACVGASGTIQEDGSCMPPVAPAAVGAILMDPASQQTLDEQTQTEVDKLIEDSIPNARNFGRGVLSNARSGTYPTHFELDTEAWAIFGQFTYTPEGFDDRLHITVGARYSKDDKQGKLQPAFVLPHGVEVPAGVVAPAAVPISMIDRDNDYDSLDPMVRAVWDLDEHSIVYGSITRGFLSGGYNIGAGGIAGGGFEFDKQNILAYEVGYKGDLLERRLRVNAAAFYYQMDDDQVANTDPLDPTSRAIANVDSESQGAELSVTYVFNEALTVNLQYAYLDTEIDPFISVYAEPGQYVNPTDPASGALFPEIQRSVIGSPENSVRITLDYAAPLARVLPWLGQDGEFHAHLGYSHVDESFGSDNNPRDQYDLFNAEVGFSIPREVGTLRVVLWAQNLFDHEYIIDSLTGRFDVSTDLYTADGEHLRTELINRPNINTVGYDVAIYGEPRTWGLTVAWDYE